MTVSTSSIPVLHSAEVAHLYLQVVLPIRHGVGRTHTPLPRKRGRVPLRGQRVREEKGLTARAQDIGATERERKLGHTRVSGLSSPKSARAHVSLFYSFSFYFLFSFPLFPNSI
jgi:hypothetical protein